MFIKYCLILYIFNFENYYLLNEFVIMIKYFVKYIIYLSLLFDNLEL